MGERIHPTRLRILLLKTVPGAEDDVAAQLRDQIPKNKAIVHVASGDFDVTALLLEDFVDQCTRKLLPNVLHARDVKCFVLMVDSEDESVLDSFLARARRAPILGYTFLRTRSLFCRPSAQRPDRKLLSWWREQGMIESGDELLLGTFGQPEFVVLHAHQTVTQAFDLLAQIASAGPCVDKGFSVFAANRDAPAEDCGSEAAGLDLQVSASCAPCHVGPLSEACQTILEQSGALEKVRSFDLPGANDFTVVGTLSGKVPVKEAVRAVLKFRKDHRGLLFNSRTRFLRQKVLHAGEPGGARGGGGDLYPEDVPAMFAPPRYKLSKEDADLIYEELQDLGPMVIRALHAAANLLSNELLIDDFVDLSTNIVYLRHRALLLASASAKRDRAPGAERRRDMLLAGDGVHRDARPEARRTWTREWLRHSLELFRVGLQQRTASSYVGSNPKEPNVNHLIGGPQKLLQAAEAAPWSVWREQRELWGRSSRSGWSGYVIFGTSQGFESLPTMVIRIAANHMFSPQDWTPLMHEMGHQIYHHAPEKAAERLTEEVDRALAALGSDWAPAFVQGVAKEIVADLCQALYGPVWHPTLPVYSYWRDTLKHIYLDELEELKACEYAIRGFLLYASVRSLSGCRDFAQYRVGDFDEFHRDYLLLHAGNSSKEGRRAPDWAQPLCDDVLELNRRIGEERLAALFDGLKHIVPVVVGPLCRMSYSHIEKRMEYWKGPCDDALQSVKRGSPPQSSLLRHPELFLWRLRQEYGESMPHAPVAAAILGLRECFRDIVLSHLRQRHELDG